MRRWSKEGVNKMNSYHLDYDPRCAFASLHSNVSAEQWQWDGTIVRTIPLSNPLICWIQQQQLHSLFSVPSMQTQQYQKVYFYLGRNCKSSPNDFIPVFWDPGKDKGMFNYFQPITSVFFFMGKKHRKPLLNLFVSKSFHEKKFLLAVLLILHILPMLLTMLKLNLKYIMLPTIIFIKLHAFDKT